LKNLRSVFVFTLLISCYCFSAFGQAVTGTLLGTVRDSSSAVVTNAKVTITEKNTAASRNTVTNGSGNYTFPDLEPGTYMVTTELEGFKKDVRDNIVVDVNTAARVDAVLQPGSLTQSVEVTAAPAPLQTDRADTSVSLSTVQTANLPIGTNRNYQSLLNLVPGTTRATFQHSQFFNASSSLQTEANGQMRMGNNYQIEGIDDNERTGLLQILVPPIEAIQTVDVSTSNFDAELGRASGAVVNVLLKSGTNELHGGIYEFFRSSDLNARNFFDQSVGHLSYNYYGGNVGGHIIKNKWFYFGDILRVTDHEANTNLLTIPTQAQIAGNLSSSNSKIYDPATGNPDGTGRTPFPGNVIPTGRINPISSELMALLPSPNVASSTGVNNYFALLPYHKDTTFYDIKSDYNVTDQDHISVRLSFQEPKIFQAPVFGLAGGPAQGAFEGQGIQRTYSGGINYNRVFSPTLVAEFRVGVAYYNNVADQAGFGANTSTSLGIPGVNLSAYTSGIVGINIGSFYSSPIIGFSPSVPWVRAETNSDIANTWTKIKGNHTIKFGGDLRLIRDALLQMQTFSPRGLYSFAPGQTGSPSDSKSSYLNNFASFLLDLPSQAGRDLPTYFPSIRGKQLFLFGQDKWVITPKLTLDLGLRWEFYPGYTGQFPGGLSNYDPANNTLIVAGVGHNPNNLGFHNRYTSFAPRTGFAYRATEKTVVRGGFGISYTPFPDNSYAYNYPVRANNEYDGLTSYVPALLYTGQAATFQNGFPASILPAIPSSGILSAPIAQSYNVVNLNFKNPYVESWNFAVQQALAGHFTLDTAYVGNHGVDSVINYNLNAGFIPGVGAAGQPEYSTFKRTASTNLLFAPFSSSYNALQVKLDRRFTDGLNITTAFTYGKGMGFQGGDDGGLLFYLNQQRNYARNDFDREYTFVQSYVYDLPFGPGKRFLRSALLGNIIGNWRVTGILTLMSGLPMTLTASGNALNLPSSTQTVNEVAPFKVPGGIGPNSAWFTASSFTQPSGSGVAGTTGRNFINGPGFVNLDASLVKLITFRERFKFELRGEAFGVTNTPQFSNPGTSITASTFGYITGAGGGRTMQLGAKLDF
jgi:hypothetical protein